MLLPGQASADCSYLISREATLSVPRTHRRIPQASHSLTHSARTVNTTHTHTHNDSERVPYSPGTVGALEREASKLSVHPR